MNDKMARKHSEKEASTSQGYSAGNFHHFGRPDIAQEYHRNTQSRNYECPSSYGPPDFQYDEKKLQRSYKTGRRQDYVSDDGTSTISGDSQWRCQVKNTRSLSLTSDTSRSKYHQAMSHASSTPSPRYKSHDHKIERMVPHSGTVSYSSSKSNTPVKQEHSYLSHNTSVRSEGPLCRICHEGDHKEVLISPCYCAGSMGLLHMSCLQRWLGSSNKTTCEICNFHFTMRRKAKPVKEFFRDPGTARDKRNLICDIVSFLLITPLTIITTWLSIAGAIKYYSEKAWEKGGLIGLAVTLWVLYLVWFMVAARHNWRLWRDWVMFHQDVTLICSPDPPPQKKVDDSSVNSGSCSNVSRVHIQGIEIKVSGPMSKHRTKDGITHHPHKLPAPVPGKGSNQHTQLPIKRMEMSSFKDTRGDKRLEKSSIDDHHSQFMYENSVIKKVPGDLKNSGNQYSEMKAMEAGLHLQKRNMNEEMFEKSKGYKQGSNPVQYRISEKKVLTPLSSDSFMGNEALQATCDKYEIPTAIFSRGHSPDDGKDEGINALSDDRNASLQYTEEWLDAKSFLGESQREGSNETVGSYHTCPDTEARSLGKTGPTYI